MNIWRGLQIFYWEWVIDSITDDIHEIEEEMSYLNDCEQCSASRELNELRECLKQAENKLIKLGMLQ